MELTSSEQLYLVVLINSILIRIITSIDLFMKKNNLVHIRELILKIFVL